MQKNIILVSNSGFSVKIEGKNNNNDKDLICFSDSLKPNARKKRRNGKIQTKYCTLLERFSIECRKQLDNYFGFGFITV